jgi:catechol 2,3-dioxygenase-like lactoylglutathione lyase family enzyme
MTTIGGFSHLYVRGTDLNRSEKFYHDLIGLDVVGRDLINEGGPNSTLALNTRHRVMLVEVDEVKPFRPNSSSIHHAWYLTPEQVDQAKMRMQAAGYEVGDNRAQFRAVGERSMDIFDPDGHLYQIQTFGAEASD